MQNIRLLFIDQPSDVSTVDYFSYDKRTHCHCTVNFSRKQKLKLTKHNLQGLHKICMIEVYLLKYHFESHLKYNYKWRYYRQTIFNQCHIMVSYVDIIGLCHSVTILWEIYVKRYNCHVRWHNFYYGTWSIDFFLLLSIKFKLLI